MNPSAEPTPHSGLNIGHVLFMDVVGYSKLLNNEQERVQRELNEIVRKTEQFRIGEAAGKLIRLPTGDGMALVFFNSPDAPVRCAVEISRTIKDLPHLPLRMGIHSGPVSEIADVNDRSNVAGAGINIAQRVMDCGDAGHILLSKRVAEDLRQDGRWQPQMHDLGECSVKHGVEVSVVNLFTDDVGNSDVPARIRLSRRQRAATAFRRRILIPAAAILIVALVSLFLLKDRLLAPANGKTVSEKSVAVLPLENLSDEKENAYFADGIQDELLSDLSKIKELKVISRTSVIQYKAGIARNLKEIAQQLGVSRVIEGSVRRYGDHVKVSVQLIDALSAHQVWSGTYDRTLADSVACQGELATEIAGEVGATLSPQEKARVSATPTKIPDAYAAYLHGRAFTTAVQSDPSNVESAIRFYEEAVKLDPGFTLAWVFLSIECSGSYWMFDSSPARLAAAKDALDHASALDPNLPETRLARGYYLYYGSRDFTGALAEFQQAQLGLPNNVDCLHAIALIHRRLGHWDEAAANFRRIVELDPRNLNSSKILATTYLAMRRFPEAIAMADQLLALDPKNREAVGQKAAAYLGMGDLNSFDALLTGPGVEPVQLGFHALMRRHYAEAIAQFSKSAADPRFGEKGELFFRLGLAQQRAGNAAAAQAAYQHGAQFLREELERAAAGAAPTAELRSFLGLAYAGLGDSELAISEGKKAVVLEPSATDPAEGPEREEAMAMIYSLLGDSAHATSILQRLLHINYIGAITAAQLRIDPVWDPIRNDPRFRELVSGKT